MTTPNNHQTGTQYWVYVLACGDGSLYTGMTTDLKKRLHQHQTKTARCKYTRRADKHPIRLGAAWRLEGVRGDALRLERYIKSLGRAEKMTLVEDSRLLPVYMAQDSKSPAVTIIPQQGNLNTSEEDE